MGNIQLETVTNFKLTSDELREMYIRLALCRFNFFRVPNYNEYELLARLTGEFRHINSELNRMVAQSPNTNNYTLHKLAAFFDVHLRNLLELELEQQKAPQPVL